MPTGIITQLLFFNPPEVLPESKIAKKSLLFKKEEIFLFRIFNYFSIIFRKTNKWGNLECLCIHILIHPSAWLR